MQTVVLNALYFPFVDLLSTVALAVVLGYGGHLYFQGALTLGTLFAFMLYVQNFFDPVQQLSQLYSTFLSATAALDKIMDVLDEEPEVLDKPDARRCRTSRGTSASSTSGSATAMGPRSCTASISTSRRARRSRSSATRVPASRRSRSCSPASTTRATDGSRSTAIDLRDVTQASLRRQLGIVPQEGFLFAGTVAREHRFRPAGRDAARRSSARPRLSARTTSSSASRTATRPQLQERGSRLSLGQRQFVALARALLADPRILILDEATSSVDIGTERKIEQALRLLLSGRTAFVIAHRLSTIRDADLIVVLEHGQIVEQGSHVELMQKRASTPRSTATGPPTWPERPLRDFSAITETRDRSRRERRPILGWVTRVRIALLAGVLALASAVLVPARSPARGLLLRRALQLGKAAGIAATISMLDTPAAVGSDHVAGWVGVGGPGLGPNGEDEWLQVGLATFGDSNEGRLYYELAQPGRAPEYTELASGIRRARSSASPCSSFRSPVTPGSWSRGRDRGPVLPSAQPSGLGADRDRRELRRDDAAATATPTASADSSSRTPTAAGRRCAGPRACRIPAGPAPPRRLRVQRHRRLNGATLPTPQRHVAGSSNGRTLGSGPSSLGSNPSPAAFENPLQIGGFLVFRGTGRRSGSASWLFSMTSIDQQALIGVFVIRAAPPYDPKEAIGLDGALQKLAGAAYGPYLLGLTAAGSVPAGSPASPTPVSGTCLRPSSIVRYTSPPPRRIRLVA